MIPVLIEMENNIIKMGGNLLQSGNGLRQKQRAKHLNIAHYAWLDEVSVS